jgi:hypothetical protein
MKGAGIWEKFLGRICKQGGGVWDSTRDRDMKRVQDAEI